MMRRFPVRTGRSGVTLLELLVVASLILTLAAVSVPAIKPMMESQQTASAASAVSTYLNRARSRAMTTGRSCGVTFEFYDGTYVDGDPDWEGASYGSACVVLRQVEVPPFYTGLDAGANVSVLPNNDAFVDDINSPYNGMPTRELTTTDLYWDKFVSREANASIQFNNCGSFYPIYNGSIVKLPGIDLPSRLNVPFKVKRDPRPTMTAPIGLTQGAVVDLEFSGCGEGKRDLFGKGSDVTVMFSPSGEVEYVRDGNGIRVPTEMIYFLVGKWDRLAALGFREYEYRDPSEEPVMDADGLFYYESFATLSEDGLWNYSDGSNFWVTINPHTGLVSTAEVNPPFNYTAGDAFAPIEESREFARVSKRNLGGH